jgi:hypothetical protein
MLITRTSMMTGKVRTLDVPVTEEQLQAWQSGSLIQKAMPHLNADQREFLLTGSTQEEWDETFGDEE